VRFDSARHEVSGPSDRYVITSASSFDIDDNRQHRFADVYESGDDYCPGLGDELAGRQPEDPGL
jgi:hypothetical protein